MITFIHRDGLKNRTFANFQAIFVQKNFLNFFQNDPMGVFLCEKSFVRIEKS
jgi:hypothetical protein